MYICRVEKDFQDWRVIKTADSNVGKHVLLYLAVLMLFGISKPSSIVDVVIQRRYYERERQSLETSWKIMLF